MTHWKKLHNPDYIGAYILEPGKDLVLTINYVKNEMVTGTDGKKEECTVVHFTEDEKPMILNATNAKTIEKIYRTPYVEEWGGKKIQLYAEKIKAFGELVDALRVRPFQPAEKSVEPILCEECGNEIKGCGDRTAAYLAQYTKQKYKRSLCSDCALKQAKASKESEEENETDEG